MIPNPEKLFHSTVRRAAVCSGPLSGMASSVVEFFSPPEDVPQETVLHPGAPQPRTLPQIIEALQDSLTSDRCLPSASIGVLCLRIGRIKGIKPAVIDLLSYSIMPAFRILLIEAPEHVSVNADFLRTLRSVCPDGRPIAWTTTCRNTPDGYMPSAFYITARSIASFTRHGFLHYVKFLSSGTDREFESIVSCVAGLNSSLARADVGVLDPLTIYVAPDIPYDSYVVTSVQSKCLRYGYSFAPM